MAASLFTAVTAVVSAATTIYVPEGGNQTIQQAVNNASAGDTIIVRDAYTGTKENINVNQTHLTIQSQNGSANCIVNASSSSDHVFEVTEDYVNISGFTVTNAAGNDKAGIRLNGRAHCNISDNNASDNCVGIYLEYSSNNNTLTKNTANSNYEYGFHLGNSDDNNVSCNWVQNNTDAGFYLTPGSTGNTTENNNIIANGALHAGGIYYYQFYSVGLVALTGYLRIRRKGRGGAKTAKRF